MIKPLGIVTLVLVAANFLARIVARIVAPDSQEELLPGLAVHGVTALAAGVAAFIYANRWKVLELLGRFILIGLAVSIIVVPIGPSISGGDFFDDSGIWMFVARLLLSTAVIVLGAGLGSLCAVALERDPTTRAYARHAKRGHVRA